MRLTLAETTELTSQLLRKFGFRDIEARYVTQNLLEAELAGRSSHGLSKLIVIKRVLGNQFQPDVKYFDYINIKHDEDMRRISESPNHRYVDANYKTGFYAIGKTLDEVMPLAQQTSVFAVGLKNVGFATGFIGAYAQKAADNSLVYIGFHNSSGGLHYFGSKDNPLGTNPITISFPADGFNTVADVSMAELNWNDVETARRNNLSIPAGKAVDSSGNGTTDPQSIFAVRSIAGHKGTALAYAVELLAGALTGSRVGFAQHGGWGAFFILVNPAAFVGVTPFRQSVTRSNESIKELMSDNELFVPGEQTAGRRQQSIADGHITITDELYEKLEDMLRK